MLCDGWKFTQKKYNLSPTLKSSETYGSDTAVYKEKLLNSHVNYTDQKTVDHRIAELDKKKIER